jgi:DNA-binding GntR family transcriptional regulator
MQIPTLKRESLQDAVARIIVEALITGELKPGDRINETELAQKAGISRGPVREALKQLEGEGILVSYPSKGTFVAKWTPKEVQEAYSLRANLEEFAVEQVIQHFKPEDIAELQLIVEKMSENAKVNNIKGLIQLDIEFHERFYVLSGHSLLQSMLSQLRRRLYALHAMDQGYAVFKDQIAMDHQEIIDALIGGDPKIAGEVIKRHILKIGEQVTEQIQH